jgi:hypothetical protein
MRHVAYLIGAFMLLPVALWIGLAAAGKGVGFAGFAEAEAVAMVVASLPLAAAFYVVNLKTIAESMRGNAAPSAPDRLANFLLHHLPAAALASTTVAAAGLWLADGSGAVAAGIAGVGAVIHVAMRRGYRGEQAPAAFQAQGRASEPRFWNDEKHLLIVIGNAVGCVVLAGVHVSPDVAFGAVLAAVPLVFSAILWIARDSTQPEAGGAP